MGRFDVVSPGAVAGDAISQYFERLALGKRAELQDQLAIEREKRLGEQHKADIELRKAEILSQGEHRKALIEAQTQLSTQRKREDATARAGMYDKGDVVRPEDAEVIGQSIPGMLADQMSLPARTLSMGVQAPGAEGASTAAVPGVIASAPTGQMISRGMPEQRAAAQQREQQEAYLRTLDPNSPQAQHIRARTALGADAPPYQAYVPQEETPEVRTAGRAIFERQPDGTWKQVAQGPASENASGLNKIWVTRGKETLFIPENAVQPGDQPFRPAPAENRPSLLGEKAALGFFNRARGADQELEGLEEEVSKLGFSGQTWMQVMPNFLQTELGQAYHAAQRAFTEARLRKDSGAAIPEHEFDNDRKTYFVQPGDTAATQAQKRRARATMLASLGFQSGRALVEFYGDDAPVILEGYKQRSAVGGPGQTPAPTDKPKILRITPVQ